MYYYTQCVFFKFSYLIYDRRISKKLYIILIVYFGEILIRCKKDKKYDVLKYYYTTDTNRDTNMLQYRHNAYQRIANAL